MFLLIDGLLYACGVLLPRTQNNLSLREIIFQIIKKHSKGVLLPTTERKEI